MTLRGKPLSDAQKAELAAAVRKNTPLKAWRYERNQYIGSLADATAYEENPTPYNKANRLRGSMRRH